MINSHEGIIPYFFAEGFLTMTFDVGTWWLITIAVSAVIGIIGCLFGRTVFKQLDKHGTDIKEVRENYTPRRQHDADLEKIRQKHEDDVERLRREQKEIRTEMRTEIQAMSADLKDIKENGIRREEFLQSQLKMECKIDKLMEFLMKGGS